MPVASAIWPIIEAMTGPPDQSPATDKEMVTAPEVHTDRDETAEERDRTSEAHDMTSEARDERAEARDRRAMAREAADQTFDPQVVSDRAAARRDRQGGANDRMHAGDDREAASTDRTVSARERAVLLVDELTGAHRREAGIMELEREINRAKRTEQPFVLAFIDVDDLKTRNDSLGHAAGDQLLRQVAETIRGHVRSYDLIIRYGGDEFLCGLLDMDIAAATDRFTSVNADLATIHGASITVGLAGLVTDDSLEDLIGRADKALFRERALRGTARGDRRPTADARAPDKGPPGG